LPSSLELEEQRKTSNKIFQTPHTLDNYHMAQVA